MILRPEPISHMVHDGRTAEIVQPFPCFLVVPREHIHIGFPAPIVPVNGLSIPHGGLHPCVHRTQLVLLGLGQVLRNVPAMLLE